VRRYRKLIDGKYAEVLVIVIIGYTYVFLDFPDPLCPDRKTE
jgi:hypothetical protein